MSTKTIGDGFIQITGIGSSANGTIAGNLTMTGNVTLPAGTTVGGVPNLTNALDSKLNADVVRISGGRSISIGGSAGLTTQGADTVALGHLAGTEGQLYGAVAIGREAGEINQGQDSIAIGRLAGETSKGASSVAIGYIAGQTTQGNNTVAVGFGAGRTSQGEEAVSIGSLSGSTSQGSQAVAIGIRAGDIGQGVSSIAIGNRAGQTNQAANSIVLNATGSALNNDQTNDTNTFFVKPVRATDVNSHILTYNDTTGEISKSTVAQAKLGLGIDAKLDASVVRIGTNSIAIGTNAGTGHGADAIAFGQNSGQSGQSFAAISLGREAGQTSQGQDSIAIGRRSGNASQGQNGVAIGYQAGQITQGAQSIAVGRLAAENLQGNNAVAIGDQAGRANQGAQSIAVGWFAAENLQGNNAVAIGAQAGRANQAANSIILNATGSALNNNQTNDTNSFFVKPIKSKDETSKEVLMYNITSGEITSTPLTNVGKQWLNNGNDISYSVGNVSFGTGLKAGSGAATLSGPFMRQSGWTTAGTSHTITGFFVADNSTGSIMINVKSPVATSAAKLGSATVLFTKTFGSIPEIFIASLTQNSNLNTFNITVSSNNLVVTTDAGCSICWVSNGAC